MRLEVRPAVQRTSILANTHDIMLSHPPMRATMDHQQVPRQNPPTILDRLTLLPLELQKHIIYDYLTVSTSPCILSLFVPDWAVCARPSDPVNEIYDLQRIDVYTKGSGGGSSGGSARDRRSTRTTAAAATKALRTAATGGGARQEVPGCDGLGSTGPRTERAESV
ncbi:hypothetical protein CFIO01_02016 [Colletotrichum fioriniae PJ7]|uniref:Uncharacterized protein n=1 Tax=Colletotrichum fioriniae PJ7 TaxID=1445577 RepID=A0A010RG35_9PEZI|nr:hypothetical protein CFIO01_02016 [Colletotrichum fioriniae PJ7]